MIRFAEYLPADAKGGHPFVCPECHARRGVTTVRGALGPSPARHLLDGPGVFRLPEADRDGVPTWGLSARRVAGRDAHRSLRVGHWGWRNQIKDPTFDTWCLSCRARMRVDSRNAGG